MTHDWIFGIVLPMTTGEKLPLPDGDPVALTTQIQELRQQLHTLADIAGDLLVACGGQLQPIVRVKDQDALRDIRIALEARQKR